MDSEHSTNEVDPTPRRRKPKRKRAFDRRADVVLKTILRSARKLIFKEFEAVSDCLSTPKSVKQNSSSVQRVLSAAKAYCDSRLTALRFPKLHVYVAALLNCRQVCKPRRHSDPDV